jgi:hypothetical protein
MDPNCPDDFGIDEERGEPLDPLFPGLGVRDEDREERMCMIIAGRAAAPVGEEDDVANLEEFSSQFLNDSGEGAEICVEKEVVVTNSGEVYIN